MSDVIMSSRITRRRNVRNGVLVVLGLFVTVFVFTFLIQLNRKSEMEVEAASLDGFDAGYIISDWQMGNYNSMSEAEIQNFLTSKNPCGNRDYDYYLRLSRNSGYQWHWKDDHFVCLSEELFGDGETIGWGDTAAHILWQTAQDYRINPQALIVLLQKETGLITDPIPNNGDYRKATGYGCPDTAPCSSEYYGFKNQVRRAAALFRTVLDGGWTNYPLGENYIQYNPNPDCGGSVVNVRSLATSALYRYTPYQPNQGAIDAGYGTAYCGAYGNRNFYLYFQDWFGDSKADLKSARIPDGIYYIQSYSDKKYVLDVAGGYEQNGGNVQIYELNKTVAQQWKVTYNSSTDDYNIINVKSNRSLDVAMNSTEDGVNIQIWDADKTCGRRWKIVEIEKNAIKIISSCSSKALDISGAVFANNTNVDLWSDNGTIAQKWELRPVKSIEEEGIYTVKSALDNSKVIDISGGVINAKNGTNIQLWNNNGTEAQRWKIIETNDGYYVIKNLQTKKVIDIIAGQTNNGANIQVWDENMSCAQKWKILENDDKTYTFISACSNKVIDVLAGNMNSGTNIQIYAANNTKAQRWVLEKKSIIPDGKYTIESELSKNKVLDIAGNQKFDGANIQLYDYNATSAQEWEIKYNEKIDYYTIFNPISKKSIDVAAAGKNDGVNVQLWNTNDSCAQKWMIMENGMDKYVFISACSGLVMDVAGASIMNSTNIQLWHRNSTMAQNWILINNSDIIEK